jgi:hypothetical protein
MQTGEGERLFAARRRRFWGVLLGLGVAGGIAGFISGFVAGHNDLGMEAVTSLPLAVRYGIVGLLAAAFAYGCWVYNRVIDEVELLDNLWSSTAGYYAFSILIPAWWLLWRMQAAPQPDVWAIFVAALVFALAVYGWRKWRTR